MPYADKKKRALYKAWWAMVDRCLNPESVSYKWYGARGITVCDRWRESFASFELDMGPHPGDRLQLDRKNNDGNYEPDNCRWATPKEQINNRRPMPRERATSCINGHPYTPENSGYACGYRVCKTCSHLQYEAKKAREGKFWRKRT